MTDTAPEPNAPGRTESAWANLWQMPTLLVGVVLFSLGVYLALPTPEEDRFGEVLNEVGLYLKAMNLEAAQEAIRTRLEPHIERADTIERARYEALWGDLVYLQTRRDSLSTPQNYQTALQHYRRAGELGLTLDGLRLQRMAETLVALRRDDEAIELLDRLKDEPARRRYLVIRQIIERQLETGATSEQLAPLLARFESEITPETDKKVRRENRLWAAVLRAKGLLNADDPTQAIKFLQRRIISMMAGGGVEDLAPLRILLAKAYQQLGELQEAQRWYRMAQQQMIPADELNADVLVGLAQIELQEAGDVRAALESYSAAENLYPTSPLYLQALVGRADCEARLAAHAEALDHLAQAARMLAEDGRPNQEKIDWLTQVIRSHYDLNTAHQDYNLALEYLSLVNPLYHAQLPAEVLIEFALTHERIAKQRLADASASQATAPSSEADTTPEANRKAKALAFQEASVHFAQAGEYYLQHARTVGASNDAMFGQSLWMAANSFDSAQHWDRAIELYAEFVKSRPDDPRQLQAINRLGQAYLSSGQYAAAAELFQRLIDEHPRSPEAYESLVSLARSHIALDDLESAQRVLLHVVTDHPAITPDSQFYKEGLLTLGKLYLKQGQYEPAIERLSEALNRYGQDPQGPMLRFQLADAYRRSIQQMDQALEHPSSQTQRLALQAERARRLEQALVLFSQVVSELEPIGDDDLPPIERLARRNAYFYRADAAYDLGRYEQAIALYDIAAARWESHPASLVALVQIVNAYCELGRTQEAKVANDRARWQLQRIPEEAFDDPSLPMTREHWQDWLRWTSELNLFGARTVAASDPAEQQRP